MAERGLVETTWKRWLLGDAGHGVALPWLDRDGTVIAVNIRRLSSAAKERRYFWEKGVYPYDQIYGAHLISHDRVGVVVVEEEFNTLALWQCAGDRYNVVSPGSSSAKLSPVWAGWIAQHGRVAVWADDLQTVDRWVGTIGREVVKIVSPVKSGVKYDANECLKCRILGAAFAKLGL